MTSPTSPIGRNASFSSGTLERNFNGTRKLKCVLVGDISVGKTSLAVRFSQHKFENAYRQTIGGRISSSSSPSISSSFPTDFCSLSCSSCCWLSSYSSSSSSASSSASSSFSSSASSSASSFSSSSPS